MQKEMMQMEDKNGAWDPEDVHDWSNAAPTDSTARLVRARVLLGLDSTEPLSACGKFCEPGDMPAAFMVGE